jgi:hypothetical protein
LSTNVVILDWGFSEKALRSFNGWRIDFFFAKSIDYHHENFSHFGWFIHGHAGPGIVDECRVV